MPRRVFSCGSAFSMRSPLKVIAPSVTRDAEEARDRPQRCSLAGAVRSQQRDDPSRPERERDALHGRDGAVVNHFKLVDCEQRLAHLRAPDGERRLNGHSRK